MNHINPDPLEISEKILLDAAEQIRRASKEHGHTARSFTMVAEMWTTYITHVFTLRNSTKLQSQDVAWMLSQLKQARATYGYSVDNFVDGAGYTALAAMLSPPPKQTKSQVDRDVDDALKSLNEVTSNNRMPPPKL